MSEHIDQIDAYLDGELPAAEAAELMRWINADASHARAFAERAVLQQEIRTNLHRSRTQTVQDPRQILQELLEHETNAQAELVEIHELSGRTLPRPNQFAALFAMPQVITGIAAAVVLCLSLFLIFQGGSDTPGNSLDPNKPQDITLASKAVATLTAQHNAIWAEGAFALGAELSPGDRLTLTAGFAEITTNDGAIAILEAPATVELLNNDNAIRLHAGKLVGICETDASKGFLVRTPHMDVTDLGTRFGIDATQASVTEVHVFEGAVQVARSGGAAGVSAPLAVHAGHALQASAEKTQPLAIDMDFGRFAAIRSWNDRSRPIDTARAGITMLSGEIAWSSRRPQDTHMRKLPRVDQIAIFSEFGGLQLDSDISVVLHEAGTQREFRTIDRATVASGTMIRSYIVALNPTQMTPIEASITFEGEVLGLVVTKEVWRGFRDAVRRLPDSPKTFMPDDSAGGSFESASNGGKNADIITLSPDRHTLSITLASAEYFRVIVRDPAGAQP